MHPNPEIETLIREHHAYIRRLVLTILDDGSAAAIHAEAEADEAAQDTFIAANRAYSGFRGDASVKTWLTRIAVNQCRARLRKRKSRRRMQAAIRTAHGFEAAARSPEESAVESEMYRRLWRAVDSLGEKHRTPVLLRYVHELSVPEIAASLDLPEGTVHSRLHHARLRLRAHLSEEISHESPASTR